MSHAEHSSKRGWHWTPIPSVIVRRAIRFDAHEKVNLPFKGSTRNSWRHRTMIGDEHRMVPLAINHDDSLLIRYGRNLSCIPKQHLHRGTPST